MEDLRPEDPRQIGAYGLLKRLGGGGMGQVFLGRSRGGRLVAVKLVRPELAHDQDFRRRFGREVRAAQRVGGFYTAHVLDADPEADPPWLATAYIPGPSLQQAVTRHGSLPESSLGLLAAGLAEGLAAVHACGMVHRDLKPGNVLLADDGPRLIDFGIARAADDTQLTDTGMVVGTPGFIAPEYILGNRAGTASDVFALGAVLAYAATGRLPFGGGAAMAVNYRVVHEKPELSGMPAAYTALIEDCLAKDATKRPGVGEVIDRVPAGDRGGGTWLPPRVTTMIDEAQRTNSTDTGGPFFAGNVEIPTPAGWRDDPHRAQKEETAAKQDVRRLLSGAETVSGGIRDRRLRSRALACVAAATTPVDPARGKSLAGEALRVAARTPEVLDRVRALAGIAKVLAVADRRSAHKAAEQGTTLAEGIGGLFRKGERRDALAVAAGGLAAVDPARAESITTMLGRSWTTAGVAAAMAVRDPARAERIARGISSHEVARGALADVAEAMAPADPARAERIARELAPQSADRVLLAVARAQTGKDPDRAERIVRQLEGRMEQSTVKHLLGKVAEKLVVTDPERAVRIARDSGWVKLSIVAEAAVEATASSDLARAERLVHAIPDASARSSALNALVEKMAGADPDRAERIAHGVADEEERALALAAMVRGLLHIDFRRAQQVARSIPERQLRTRAGVLTLIAGDLAAYDPAAAERLLHEAETIAAGLSDPDEHGWVMADVARELASTDPARAADLARTIREPEERANTLSGLAKVVAPAMPERATALYEEAARAARDVPEPAIRNQCLTGVVESAAPHAPQWAVALALETPWEGGGDDRRPDLARILADFVPETAARIAVDFVHTARRTHDEGDEYNIYGLDGLVLLAQIDPRRAAELAVSHGPADGPDETLWSLVKELAEEAGWELEPEWA